MGLTKVYLSKSECQRSIEDMDSGGILFPHCYGEWMGSHALLRYPVSAAIQQIRKNFIGRISLVIPIFS